MTFLLLPIFGTFFLDLISKIALRNKGRLKFEVPITVTSISLVLSGIQWLIESYILTPDNFLYTLCLPNTVKWIVVQGIIKNLANKHNESKQSHQLKKSSAKRQRQCEGAQLKRKLKIQVNFLERPSNVGGRNQFEICTKRERLDEGVFLKKNPNPNRKLFFSTRTYRSASFVDNRI